MDLLFLIIVWYFLNGIKSNLEKISACLSKMTYEPELDILEGLKHMPYNKKIINPIKKKRKRRRLNE